MTKKFNKYYLLTIFSTIVLVVFQKLLVYENCFSFDTHDDSNHAFPNLKLVRESILNFQFSFFNYFNNFGQPLLGDGLTYPFSAQSITYYFFDEHIAMTVNRILILFFTLLMGFFFFFNYFKKDTSIILSIISVFNPVVFWYPVHHYQMTLLFYFSLLILIRKIIYLNTKKSIFVFLIIFIFFINSVSILHVLLSLPFLFLFTFITNNKKIDRNLLIVLGLIISSFVLTANQNIEFIENILDSGRNNQFVYSSDLANLREFFLSLIIPPKEWFPYNYGAQNSVITYYSLPILSGIFLGLWFNIRNRDKFFFKALLCGLIPFMLVILLNYLSFIRVHIPFIKSIDIKRIFYFCYPFSLFFLGSFLEAMSDNKIKKNIVGVFSALLILTVIFLFTYFQEIENITLFYFFNIIIFLISITYYGFTKKYFSKKIFYSLFILSLFLTLIPTLAILTGVNTVCKGGSTQYATQSEESDFVPAIFLNYIEPYSRAVAEIHTHRGHSLRLANNKIFGGDGRGIILNKNFGNFLEKKNLVQIDQVPYGYYFKRPWNISKLNKLGIRYIITHKKETINDNNFTKIADTVDFNLYENKSKPTIINIIKKDDKETYHKYKKVIGNQLIISDLDSIDFSKVKYLDIAIMYRKHFEIINQDNKKINFIKNKNNLISIIGNDLRSTSQLTVTYRYNFINNFFLFFFFIALIYIIIHTNLNKNARK